MMWMTLRSLDALIKVFCGQRQHPGVWMLAMFCKDGTGVGSLLLLLYPCRVYRPDMEMLATILKELGSGVWSGQCGV
ncbi:hypothetical protein Pcinc_030106 [Petrolisthes cinctipes]|uniref:Uncharacterized protein n=1 Tax=Petrolisthes cinctipes TaxID=88211 RepID=A0AAE1EZI2_PETCI|nr:hypothetical protein Pcinc_030106 [Petrolisthes cinctipes]